LNKTLHGYMAKAFYIYIVIRVIDYFLADLLGQK